MNVVIATLIENESINLFADRRMVKQYENGTYVETLEVAKVYELTDILSCGMTGDAQRSKLK